MGVFHFARLKNPLFTGVLIFFCFVFACLGPAFSQGVPEDFEVVFTSQPALVGEEIEVETLTLKANGETSLSPKAHYQGTFPDYTREELPAQTQALSQEAVGEIYRAVTASDFFSLDPEYADHGIMDGDLATLTITANGQTHSVTTRNIRVRAFDRITVTINSFLPEERRLLYNAINGADYEEVER